MLDAFRWRIALGKVDGTRGHADDDRRALYFPDNDSISLQHQEDNDARAVSSLSGRTRTSVLTA